MRTVKCDLLEAGGSIQLCAGQDTRCQAAVRAMECIFAENNTEAMILVDATNVFNHLNRQVTLVNCGTICPAMSHILVNTYCNNSLVDSVYYQKRIQLKVTTHLRWQCMQSGLSH